MFKKSVVGSALTLLLITAPMSLRAWDWNDGWGTKGPEIVIACKNNDYNQATRLLQQKANSNARDSEGNSCLIHATKNQNVHLVKKLLEYKATDEKANNAGDTALMIAARSAHSKNSKENKNFEEI